jgi:hypothetical protein
MPRIKAPCSVPIWGGSLPKLIEPVLRFSGHCGVTPRQSFHRDVHFQRKLVSEERSAYEERQIAAAA